MNREVLQKLLEKIIAKKIIDNFNDFLYKKDIKKIELSSKAGKGDNAFSKTLNEMKTPKLTTILRFISALNELLIEKNFKKEKNKNYLMTVDSLLDEEIIGMLKITNDIADADMNVFLIEHRTVLKGCVIYLEILNKKNNLNCEEEKIYQIIREL